MPSTGAWLRDAESTGAAQWSAMRRLGRYELRETLGSGAFATVWKGYDPDLDAVVAIKILAENWTVNADVRERFLTEARLLRKIESSRIVRVHDVGIADGRPYFVMDYVNGGTLAERIGTVEPQEALRLAAEAAYAVQALHDAGVVHRDIKPSNLLVDISVEPCRVLVADLGSAKLLADASGITVTTGSPAYMAPEQAGLSGGFDGRADVYALGIVAYELVAGRRPFDGMGTSRRIERTRPAPLSGERDVAPAVDDALRSALDPHPERRPRDAGAFGDMLVTATGVASGTPQGRQWSSGLVIGLATIVFVIAAFCVWLIR